MNHVNKLCLALLFAAAGQGAAFAAAENPIMRLFPADVVYRQGFDDGTLIPDVGRVAKTPDPKRCEFAEGGVFGRCLSAGSVHFGRDADGLPLMDTQVPGTAVFWVRYVEDPPEGRKTGFIWFIADMVAPEGQRGRLMALKLHDNGIIFLFEYYIGKKRFTASAQTGISYEEWQKGEWRMFAVSWDGDKLGLSQNGMDFNEVPYNLRLLPLQDGIELRAPGLREKGRFYQLDEFAVLDRKLSNAEIRKLYVETMKCRESK